MNKYHTDVVTEFNRQYYHGTLTKDHVISPEVCKKIGGSTVYGFELQNDFDKYFIKSDFIKSLPIIVKESEKFHYKNNVFNWPKKLAVRIIKPEDKFGFKKLVDNFCDYEHSDEAEWTLFKIIMLAAYIDRINIRIVTPASFGKDGVANILNKLMSDTTNLYQATLAKMKFALNNKLIFINEVGNLKPEEISNLQTFLLQAGAYQPTYENNSRKFQGVKETIDISNKSLVIFHNTQKYYDDKKQKYFETMFTDAVLDRFPPIYFNGYVKEDFSQEFDKANVADQNRDHFVDIIKTIKWYREHRVVKEKYKLDEEFWGFVGKQKQRSQRSFNIISKYIAEYSENEHEFLTICKTLKNCMDNNMLTYT